MNRLALAPVAILFVAPVLASQISPNGSANFAKSFGSLPSITSNPTPPVVRTTGDGTVIFSSGSSSGLYEPGKSKYGIYEGVLGPSIADQPLKGTFTFQAFEDGDYVIRGSYSNEPYVHDSLRNDYIFWSNLPYSLKKGETISLPTFAIPGRYIIKGICASLYLEYSYKGARYSVGGRIYAQDDYEWTLPTATGRKRIPCSVIELKPQVITSLAPQIWDEGFSDKQVLLTNGQIPFSKMRLTVEEIDWGQRVFASTSATLTLLNHIDDFATGSSDGAKRVWDLDYKKNDCTYRPMLKTAEIFNPGTGLMREGVAIHGAEFRTNEFYLPPCKKEEVGTKEYSFAIEMKFKTLHGNVTLKNNFVISPVASLAAGCEDGDYCVGVR